MAISSQAPKGEGSETIPQGSTLQVKRKRPAPMMWGEDIVQSRGKLRAVKQALKSLYSRHRSNDPV